MSHHRTVLHEQLRRSGEAAVAMLQGRQPPDPALIWAAAEAAGLLDAVTAGAALRPLRAAVLAALQQGALPPLTIAPVAPGADALAQVLRLGGLAAALPSPWAERLREALEHAELALAALAQEDEAGALLDALDLDDAHPVVGLLRVLATPIPPAPPSVVALGIASAQEQLFPAGLRLWAARLRGHLDALVEEIDALLQAPLIAQAASSAPAPTLHRRHNLYARNGQEVNLVVLDRRSLALEWVSEGAPPPLRARFAQQSEALEAIEALVEGGCCWRLQAPPPGDLHLVLEGPAGTLEVWVAQST